MLLVINYFRSFFFFKSYHNSDCPYLVLVNEGVSINECFKYSRKSYWSFAGTASVYRSTGNVEQGAKQAYRHTQAQYHRVHTKPEVTRSVGTFDVCVPSIGQHADAVLVYARHFFPYQDFLGYDTRTPMVKSRSDKYRWLDRRLLVGKIYFHLISTFWHRKFISLENI